MKNLLKNLFLLLTITIITIQPSFSSAREDLVPLEEIKVDGQTIYTSQVEIPSGETAYFACEPIYNEGRRKAWFLYKRLTERLCNSGDGAIYRALHFVNSGQLNDVLDYHLPTGSVHRDSFKALVEGVPEGKVKKTKDAVEGIQSGAAGMCFLEGAWITYVSNEPITGFCPLHISPGEYPGLDEYISLYPHMIMSVSSFDMIMSVSSFDMISKGELNFYQHRGIFRHPMSMLRGDFRGIGLLTHAFTGRARLAMDPRYEYMCVNTDANFFMEKLLLGAFDATELSPRSISSHKAFSEKFPLEAQEAFLAESSVELPSGYTHIKLSALAAKFPK